MMNAALRALVAFYGVDADGVEPGDAEPLYLLPYHRYLVAVRHDDPYCLVGVKLCAIEAMDALEHVRHDACFLNVHLVGYLRLAAVLRREEEHAVCLQQVVDSVLGRQVVTDGRSLLMG